MQRETYPDVANAAPGLLQRETYPDVATPRRGCVTSLMRHVPAPALRPLPSSLVERFVIEHAVAEALELGVF